jgi:uncharacterized membrane protein
MAKGSQRGGPPQKSSPADELKAQRDEYQEILVQTSMSWQAPIPPPEMMKGYNDIIPNGAERLFRQFEIEAEERRILTRRGQTHQFIVALSGRGSALIFALAALAVSAFVANLGHPTAAAVIGSSTIAMVVAAFTGIPQMIRQRANIGKK